MKKMPEKMKCREKRMRMIICNMTGAKAMINYDELLSLEKEQLDLIEKTSNGGGDMELWQRIREIQLRINEILGLKGQS